MKDTEELLREAVRTFVDEDLKNVRSKHAHTAAGTTALRKMHDAKGVLAALENITQPMELVQVLEAVLDAVSIAGREEVLKALSAVTKHEKTTRAR